MHRAIARMLKEQYERTMRLAYAHARAAAASAPGEHVLDCGSGSGHEANLSFGKDARSRIYCGLEWDANDVALGQARGLDIREADLNLRLPLESASQDCVIAYSVLEHLLMPCAFIKECHRVLKPGGRLVILTPNISTYFTVLQILFGKMPSSGPHPDSNVLMALEEPIKVSDVQRDNLDSGMPQHRHLVVFSFKVLRRFLLLSGFSILDARGFGYYPFPLWLQAWLERVDKMHCHQMVFVCKRLA